MRLLLSILCLLPVLSAFATEVAVLDDFKYPDAAALRAAWEPMKGTPPAEFMAHGDKQALKIPCPFATLPDIERGSFDRKVNLDLMTAGAITFDFYCDDPSVISYPSIYFHSGDGWYGHSFGLAKGWQRVVLPKGTFHIEDSPAGWDKVDTIRISAWKSKAVDTFCGFDNLEARTEDIAIIAGVVAGAEGRAVGKYAEQISDFLEKTGVPYGALTDTDVAGGALAKQKLAIFAYSPAMTPEVIAKVQEFVNAGGKIIVFYSLPGPVADLLGAAKPTYRGREREGQFADVVFEPCGVTGLPARMGQNSWNVTGFEAGGHNARVIAHWQDAEGKDQGPAVLLSDNGAFMGHVLTEDTPAAKQAFLMALVGHFVPRAWETAAQVALQRAQAVGPYADRQGLDEYLSKATPGASFAPKVRAALAQAKQAETEAKQLLGDKKYPEVLAAAARYHGALMEAYFVAHKSRTPEFRAVWNHSGTGDCGTWDEAMRLLKAGNFNAVVPNMWWGGVAYYDSKLLPHAPLVAKQGDQIAQCVAAGKKYGIEVHPWKVNWNLANAPAEFIEKMRTEGAAAGGQQGRGRQVAVRLQPGQPAARD